MKLSDYIKKTIDAAKELCTVEIEFNIRLNDKCEVDEKGSQRIHFKIYSLK